MTHTGPDRDRAGSTGARRGLSQLIAAHGGSWDESRMARLAGHFAGVVQIQIPAEHAADLIGALPEARGAGSLGQRGR